MSEAELLQEVKKLRVHRYILAKLACDEPQFFNPLDVWEAQKLRDEVIAEEKAAIAAAIGDES